MTADWTPSIRCEKGPWASRFRFGSATLASFVLLFVLGMATAWPALAAAPRDAGKPLADQAAVLFKAGKFLPAAELFERAFALNPSKLVRLRNAGRAFEEAGRLDHARHLFQRYIELAPAGRDRDEVQDRIAKLTARLAPTATAETVTATGPPPAPQQAARHAESGAAADSPTPTVRTDSPQASRWPRWLAAGAGAGLAAVGVVWLAQVADAQDRFDSDVAAHHYEYVDGPAKRSQDEDVLERNRVLAWTCTGLGVAGAVGGVLWALAPQPVAGVHILPTKGGFRLAYAF